MVVGAPPAREEPVTTLQKRGYQCAELDNPYEAMAELCRRPLVYRALILSLGSLYREELGIIATVKGRFPHVEIWLSHTDGRAAALAEATRMGADGILADDGFHRFSLSAGGMPDYAAPAMRAVAQETAADEPAAPPYAADPQDDARGESDYDDDAATPDALLTADELRALLQDHTVRPAGAEEGD